MYKRGYDVRFQITQVIPVVITEVITRLMYSVRRLISYYENVEKENRSFKKLWEYCEPFKNATVKHMLTIAHGTFCILGEVSRKISYEKKKNELKNMLREEKVIKNYIEGLEILYELYDDKELLTFVEDLKGNKTYINGFEKTVKLAEKRKVPEEKIIRSKDDIDKYFGKVKGEKKEN